MSAPKQLDIFDVVRGLWFNLGASNRRLLFLLAIANLIASLSQLAFAVLIASFVGVVVSASPLSGTLSVAAAAAEGIGIPNGSLAILGAGAFLMSLVSGALSVTSGAGNIYLVFRVNRDFSVRLLESYLKQDYLFLKGRRSSDLLKRVIEDVADLSVSFLVPLLEALGKCVLIFVFASAILLWNPTAALAILALLAVYYIVIARALLRRLRLIGDRRVEAQKLRFSVAVEIFNSFREILLNHQEATFIDLYFRPTNQFARLYAAEAAFGQAPRLFLEALAVAVVVGAVIATQGLGGDMTQLVPIITLYSVAAYRLLPSVQSLFASVAQMQARIQATDSVLKDIRLAETRSHGHLRESVHRAPFRESFELRSVSFTYAAGDMPVISNVNLLIRRGEFAAICGRTGSGKSTLLDMIVGLIPPPEGSLIVDGSAINKDSLRAWQRNFGYVSQEVILLDRSIVENIAFWDAGGEIDLKRAQEAARLAEIHDFIVQDLPQGYNTIVGERGARLSGGQRQRIGIARALYSGPDILLLDEATSALDAVTEARVVENIRRQRPSLTILAITHRLSSVRNADRIHLLNGGRVVASGTYDELRVSNAEFQALALEGAAV